MQRLFAFTDFIVRVFLWVAMAALVVMMLSIVSDVFMRYVFNAPIVGSYDVVEISLCVAVFYSIGAVIYGLREIVIDLIDHFVSPAAVKLLVRVAALLSAFALLFIFNAMLTPAIQSYQYGEMRLELKMPVWIIWAIALVGMSGGVLASVTNIFRAPVGSELENQTDQSTS